MIPYLEIPPEDPLHRRIITAAIESQDMQALKALQGSMDQPIHFVTNWFYYGLMSQDIQQKAVIIYSPEAREGFRKMQQHSDGLQPQSVRPAQPLSKAYEFLNYDKL